VSRKISISIVSLSKEVHGVNRFQTHQTPCAATDRNIMTKIHNWLDSQNSRPGPKHNTDTKNVSADSDANGSELEIMLMLQPNLQELLCSKLEGPASVLRSSVNVRWI
jgi:hypothetical protein